MRPGSRGLLDERRGVIHMAESGGRKRMLAMVVSVRTWDGGRWRRVDWNDPQEEEKASPASPFEQRPAGRT